MVCVCAIESGGGRLERGRERERLMEREGGGVGGAAATFTDSA
jgi:hypothetical protein